jgi:high mobility group protein B2
MTFVLTSNPLSFSENNNNNKMAGKKSQRDPGAPKRNMSAYLLYQNAMREQFKALNPGMTFGQLSKYTSAMYAELPPSEKEAWIARAEADKARYIHELATYAPPPGFDITGDAILTHTTTKRKGKTERDINAPKRNLSAYLLYQNAMREQFKRENPGMSFGQLAKYTSHMYKNMTPEEKGTWEARAQQDKTRYGAELSTYVPPPGHDARGNLIEEQRPRKRNKRGPKDPAAPKRASGAYVFFTNEMRPKVLSEYPGIKFVELGRVLGQRWRALTPEEKKKFEEMAADDKIRFQLEMQQYTATQAAAAVAAAPSPPTEHQYYNEISAGTISYDYAAHDVHDPYGQHAPYHA